MVVGTCVLPPSPLCHSLSHSPSLPPSHTVRVTLSFSPPPLDPLYLLPFISSHHSFVTLDLLSLCHFTSSFVSCPSLHVVPLEIWTSLNRFLTTLPSLFFFFFISCVLAVPSLLLFSLSTAESIPVSMESFSLYTRDSKQKIASW